jgi:hypothetical protein
MNTTLHQKRNINLLVVAAFAVTLIAAFTFAVAPSIVAPRPAPVPAVESQNAFLEYLRGEKEMYTNPVELNNALAAYHLGEKVIVGNALESAMLDYRQGEKAIYVNSSDLDAALAAYHRGEKETVNLRESAWITHILGEKDIK